MTDALTAGQRASLQAALERRRQALEQQIAQQLDGRTRPEHARDVLLQDGDDAPARDADREVDLARSDLEIDDMRSINDALARIEAGQYGLCSDCERPIPYNRLQHYPQALRCVACQSAHESQSGQPVQRTKI
jgi:DnaK suppressor protein